LPIFEFLIISVDYSAKIVVVTPSLLGFLIEK